MTAVPVRKPPKECFVRTHRDESYWLRTHVLELKEDREIYLVDPALWPTLACESTFGPRLLVTTVTRQGVLLLWPIRLPGHDERIDEWNRSALEAACTARDSWVRVTANMNLGANDVSVASGIVVEPEFPVHSMGAILRVAFKGKFIDSADHAVLRKLRGEL